jgi:hypothetical protein
MIAYATTRSSWYRTEALEYQKDKHFGACLIQTFVKLWSPGALFVSRKCLNSCGAHTRHASQELKKSMMARESGSLVISHDLEAGHQNTSI